MARCSATLHKKVEIRSLRCLDDDAEGLKGSWQYWRGSGGWMKEEKGGHGILGSCKDAPKKGMEETPELAAEEQH